MKSSMRILYWTPRILGILAILFISMFALDAFNPALTIWQQIGGFLIHMIPSFVLLGILAVAWKWELIGGLIFTLIGLAFSPVVYLLNYNRLHSVKESLFVLLIITVPFILTGLLFILSYRHKKRVRIED